MAMIPLSEKQFSSPEERLTIDPVTGLRNEYLFRLSFPAEFSRARERETNGALLIIKLANILEINDRHGRTGGDEALRACAHLFQMEQNEPENRTHLVFKLAGPVFAYVIPAGSAEKSRALAEKICELAIRSELFIDRLVFSIGIVNLYEFFLQDGDIRQITGSIEQTAFHRLAIAEKKSGNTVCDTSGLSASQQQANSFILFVDPDLASIELLVRALQAADFEVRTCQDGETALAIIQERTPDVIVCEAMTPRLNGFTIRERLRVNAFWNAVPFILFSHKKSEDFIRKAIERDIRFFFRKPVSVIEIVGLVTNITRKRLPL